MGEIKLMSKKFLNLAKQMKEDVMMDFFIETQLQMKEQVEQENHIRFNSLKGL
jgi:hypothetical protein